MMTSMGDDEEVEAEAEHDEEERQRQEEVLEQLRARQALMHEPPTRE